MLRYVAKRLVYMLITLFVIVSVTFFISKLLPGTPFADDKLTPQIREQLFEKYGLDEPLYVQYAKYVWNVAQGDLGNSFYYESRPVTQMILQRAPVSMFVGVQAVVFGLVVGLVLGVVAALRHNTFWDTLAVVVAVIGIGVPNFVLGPLLQYWFGVKLGWFPIAFFESYRHSVLPSLALSVFVISTVARFVRSEMLEVMGQDYVVLARAKGISNAAVIVRHVLRNALIPLITVLAPLTIYLITGSLVVEQIFAVPGIGEMFVQSVFVNDYAMILGTTIFFSALFIAALLVQDILYGVVDPRIRVSGAKE
ncbi:binding-protein-dependent transport systems inner membrane component [Rubrobacter xylanophilus DSM 9941]|uniref:Binding-protein-dependent transport systems inner membrane component n=1 Tax=Rubrobacter xylanophilus (strain DSM 9941 / JCM 11954 / NBRC 16129 / PRD-1) TaxID=266117 RepID=Q1AXP4_RUBXD|nr:ABC transporter permease [Rubrobacter xylanophilus]ABG03834.1 binding-protein-dependent transport systems inner membrane component [Rubrobacter xylanophilus DSM 9941]